MTDRMIKVKRRTPREDGYGTYLVPMQLRQSRVESVSRSPCAGFYEVVMVSGNTYTVEDTDGDLVNIEE
jgi:hypothetical protein